MEPATLSEREMALLRPVCNDINHLVANRLFLCESPIERLFLLGLCSPLERQRIPWPSDFIPSPAAFEQHGKEGIFVDFGGFADLSQLQGNEDIRRVRMVLGKKPNEFGFAFAAVGRGGEASSYILAQVELPGTPFRVDFVLIDSFDTAVVIEADGHDFHERTKEQAAKDRERDRLLALSGWSLLRFTGSEIWRDPIACAQQAIAFVAVEHERRRGRPRHRGRR